MHLEVLMLNPARMRLEGDSLAAARLPDKSKSAARHHVDVEAVKDGHQRARRVAEGDVAELYVPKQKSQLLPCIQETCSVQQQQEAVLATARLSDEKPTQDSRRSPL